MNFKRNHLSLAAILLSTVMLAACGGSKSSTPTGGIPGGGTPSGGTGGATLTLSAPFTSITGLTYNAAIGASTAPPSYSRVWTASTPSWGMLDLIYTVDPAGDWLSVTATTSTNSIWAGTPTGPIGSSIICRVTNATTYEPLCSSWGITVSRSAGTMSLASTPVFDISTNATGTMSGTFSFAAF